MGARGGGGGGGGAGWRVAPGRAPALMLAVATALGLFRVSAVEVKTPEELFVENGTEARLPCTFLSSEVISSAASVFWSFQPEGATTRISLFYYAQGNSYPGRDLPFKNRISWAGDLNKKDASVSIANVEFQNNGTYFCDVKNPPDIVVKPGEIRLRVVQRVRVSAVEVKTPEELFVENGTEARLPCTFSSSEVISSAASVSWSFQPEGATTHISFFHYSQGNPYPGKDTPFMNRIGWAGDLNKKDASVSIANVQFQDNGTYFCDVKNPPDIVIKPREIRLRVVQRVRVSAMEVKTPEELFVENGTEARLPCTFSSSEVISSAASVSWSFQPEGATTRISFFHYSQGNPYIGKDPPFKNRISWAGDLNKKDASVSIANVQFQDNGTYFCDVKNPPDIIVKPGEIRLRVVQRDNLPAFPIGVVVAIAAGGTLGVLLLIAVLVCVVRKKNSKKHYSGCSTSESLMSPAKQAPRKSPSNTEGLVNHVPTRLHQGPVIYAQLDHSGGQHSDKINKSESVVYADIRKN